MSGTIDIAAISPAAPPPDYMFSHPDDAGGSSHFMRVLAEVKQDHGGNDDNPDAAGATAGSGLNTRQAGCVAGGAAAGAVIGGVAGGEMCGQQPQPLVPHHVASTSNEGGAPAGAS